MELDERKQKILNAIIQNYQETGEPVGSRTISKYTELQLSPATIRNEMADLKEDAGSHSEVVSKVLDAVAEAIGREEEVPVYTSGAPNIFKYPELTGGDKASELISTLEEKKGLRTIMASGPENSVGKQDIQVYIGDEVPVESMKDCSVVTATYELGEGVQGKIGIIGPKRMDYQKVVDTLKNTMSQLDDIFKKE